MEPDDIPVHDLLGVGDEPGPGTDELRAIVARAGRKRWAMGGVAATLALGLGLGIGFATSGGSTPSSQTAAAGSPAPQNGAQNGASPSVGASSGASSGTPSYSTLRPISPGRFTRLFTRPAGRVSVRGFLVTAPQIFAVPAACALSGSQLEVEVSTANMVGSAGSGPVSADRSRPVSAVSSQLVGTAEGDPVAVVTVATGTGVAQVSMSFAGGTDAMAPVQGWAALVAPVASSLSYGSNLGMLTVRDHTDKVLAQQAVNLGVLTPQPPTSSCSVGCPLVQPQAGASTGSAGRSSAFASGSAGSSSASANSGSSQMTVACPPLPCYSVPRLTVPSKARAGSGASAAGSGTPTISSAATGAAPIACPLPAEPVPTGPSGGASNSGGASP